MFYVNEDWAYVVLVYVLPFKCWPPTDKWSLVKILIVLLGVDVLASIFPRFGAVNIVYYHCLLSNILNFLFVNKLRSVIIRYHWTSEIPDITDWQHILIKAAVQDILIMADDFVIMCFKEAEQHLFHMVFAPILQVDE